MHMHMHMHCQAQSRRRECGHHRDAAVAFGSSDARLMERPPRSAHERWEAAHEALQQLWGGKVIELAPLYGADPALIHSVLPHLCNYLLHIAQTCGVENDSAASSLERQLLRICSSSLSLALELSWLLQAQPPPADYPPAYPPPAAEGRAARGHEVRGRADRPRAPRPPPCERTGAWRQGRAVHPEAPAASPWHTHTHTHTGR